MNIGQRLAHLMLFRGVSSSELADKIGTTRQSVAYWKSGRNKPNPESAKRIAGVLDCSPVWLMTGQCDPPEGFGNIRAIDSEDEVPAGFGRRS